MNILYDKHRLAT